ncbi:PRTRC system ParB family protein [Ottowia sp.]|uniref:PRTRC system ParB family protein n=1 Tax=Ottowia sp. TaxID=1898956 RepID=UPI0025E27607|nr:PRTRC system ParB family protein [Ottowia sp.]MBK6616366.1 PRTRC system ParB family protein [Ottowia sp.]
MQLAESQAADVVEQPAVQADPLMRSIPLRLLRLGKNPRTYFAPKAMAELVLSVRANGIATPILVRALEDGFFEIIAGERRVRAATEAFGLEWAIPALIRECDDSAAERLGLVENTDREAMSASDEAQRAFDIVTREKGDVEEAALRLGCSVTTLRRRLALMALLPELRAALTERRIDLGHAELLAANVPQEKQLVALAKIIELKMTVEQVKAYIASTARDLTKAVFSREECASCPNNSAQQAALFAEVLREGQCTRAACFESKTEAHLEALRVSLLDEVPKVVILRHDSGMATIRLVAEGAVGVGDEQAKACRTCENFGCTVSAVVGSVGSVENDICFDGGCHTLKVAANVKAQRALQRAAATASKGTGDAGAKAGGAGGKRAARAAATVTVPQKVKDYRVAQWRKIAAHVTFSSGDKAFLLLLGIGLSGNARHVDSTKMAAIYEVLTKEKTPSLLGSVKGAADVVAALTPEVAQRMAHAMAASCMKQLDERQLVGAMEFLAVDLGKFWKLSAEFLGLLTKSEIGAVAEEVGLAAAMGDKEFKKALGGKKEECIKALLAVQDFPYQGAVPRVMDYRPANAGEAESVDAAEEEVEAQRDAAVVGQGSEVAPEDAVGQGTPAAEVAA